MLESLENLKLFQKSYDFYKWIYPILKDFPKSERYTLVEKIHDTLLSFISKVVEARKVEDKNRILKQADAELEKLKVLMRLSKDQEFISMGQYRKASEKLDELGKMLGGWMKS
jgi:four helix bundle protein